MHNSATPIRIGWHRVGSASERLSARLDDVEPALQMSMENIAKLIADWALLQDRVQAHENEIHQLQTMHRVCNAEDRLMSLELFRNCSTFWRRLRWLIRGV